MQQYNVFRRAPDKFEAVKQGWSWPGFFFGFIWAFVKGMAGPGLWILALTVLVAIVPSPLSEILSLGVGLMIGSTGNQWRETNLLKRDFVLVGNCAAKDPEEAISLLKNRISGTGAAQPHEPEEEREMAPVAGPKGLCPNCKCLLPLASEECPECQAIFGDKAGWKITPVNSSS